MAISNEWQAIDGLSKITKQDNANVINLTIFDQASVQKIASAIGWETIHLSDYSQTLTLAGTTTGGTVREFTTDDVYLVRPIDDNEYGVGLLPLCYMSGTNGVYGMWGVVNLSTGVQGSWCQYGYEATSILILRPTATGCFAVKGVNGNNIIITVFDKFENPKNGSIKWGMISSQNQYIYAVGNANWATFENLYTGEGLIHTSALNLNRSIIIPSSNFYPYVALKKFTAINTTGVFVARTLYCSYIDYSTAERTIEVEGDRYRNVGSTRETPLYIPLN